MDKKVCVVAGGAGFIGSHLVDALLESGYVVIAADNLITGRKENLTSAFKHSAFRFVETDVSKSVEGISGHVDFIFHLASPASVPDYQKYPRETALVNSVGTMNLLELTKRNNAKFLFASTSEIYGDPLEHPQTEKYWGNVNPVGVRSCYDEAKRFGETLTMIYIRSYGVDGRIIRIFNTYGPRMRPDDGRVVSNFINQALTVSPLTMYGDGTQTRSFCFISDLVDGIQRAMFTNGTNGEIFNLGNPQERTVRDLAEIVLTLTGSVQKIINKDLPDDDPKRRKPDITKAIQKLGWTPVVESKEGLKQTIAYYQSLLNIS